MIFAFSALSIAHKQPFCTELQRRDAIDKLLFRRHRRRHCRQRLPTFVVWHSNPSTRTVSITCRCVDVSMTFVAPNSFGIFIYQIPHFILYYIVILYWPLYAVNVACSSRLSRRATITHHMWGKMVMHSIAAYIVKCCVSAWTLTDTRHTCTVQAAPVHLHEPRTRSARAHIIYTNVCGAFESVRIRRICQPIVISAWLNCIPFDRLLLPYIYATAANVSDSSP